MKKLLTITTLMLLTTVVIAGQPFRAVEGSKITVSGTSTMHDWEMTSGKVQVQASIAEAGNGAVAVEALKMTLPVNTLKSQKNGMDENAYKALKAKEHPQIVFELATSKAKSGNQVEAAGKLTIAGKTQTVATTGKLETLDNGNVRITGSYTLNMTDYEVEPPSFMFGTVSTGEEVTISYEIILSR